MNAHEISENTTHSHLSSVFNVFGITAFHKQLSISPFLVAYTPKLTAACKHRQLGCILNDVITRSYNDKVVGSNKVIFQF